MIYTSEARFFSRFNLSSDNGVGIFSLVCSCKVSKGFMTFTWRNWSQHSDLPTLILPACRNNTLWVAHLYCPWASKLSQSLLHFKSEPKTCILSRHLDSDFYSDASVSQIGQSCFPSCHFIVSRNPHLRTPTLCLSSEYTHGETKTEL